MDNTGAVLDFTLALFDCSNFNDVTKTKNGIFFFSQNCGINFVYFLKPHHASKKVNHFFPSWSISLVNIFFQILVHM